MLEVITWPVAFACVSALAIMVQALIKIFESSGYKKSQLKHVQDDIVHNTHDTMEINKKIDKLNEVLTQLSIEKNEFKRRLDLHEEEYEDNFRRLEEKIEKVTDLIIDILRSAEKIK